MLDIWPDLPIFVRQYHPPTLGMDNIVATLEHNDRVREIDLWLVGSSQFEEIVPAMQERFPALTVLKLRSTMELEQVLPDSFLGGSAPRLQSLWLGCVPFPRLPKPLLSARDLVDLSLWDIPLSGYISLDSMFTSLSASTRLEKIALAFLSRQPHPNLESRCTSTSPRSFPRSSVPFVQRDPRIHGLRILDRCLSTQPHGYILFQSICISHSTPLPIHQLLYKARYRVRSIPMASFRSHSPCQRSYLVVGFIGLTISCKE